MWQSDVQCSLPLCVSPPAGTPWLCADTSGCGGVPDSAAATQKGQSLLYPLTFIVSVPAGCVLQVAGLT
jgi:hypothetical protein